MGIARQILREVVTACLPASRWLVRGPRTGNLPTIALTFDDGPHPEHTPRVLEALQRWNAVGTFFVIGEAAERYPELLSEIVAAGHQIGNHTWTHSEPRTTSSSLFLEEVERTDHWLESHGAARPYWMRPPKGELTLSKLRGLWRMQHGVALWNVDPRDYQMTQSEDALRWATRYEAQSGDIVLLHDRCPAASIIVDTLGRRGVLASFRSQSLDVWRESMNTASPTGRN